MNSWREIKKRILKDWQDYKILFFFIGLVYGILMALGKNTCMVKAVLNIDCPGCGLTRSFLMIATGRFSQAWNMHPFVYAWILFGFVFLIERYLLKKSRNIAWFFLVIISMGMLWWYGKRILVTEGDRLWNQIIHQIQMTK